jgi:hypothetical protein
VVKLYLILKVSEQGKKRNFRFISLRKEATKAEANPWLVF